MAEQLTNTNFGSNITGWDYDDAYYIHDSGWAKCQAYEFEWGDTGVNDYMIWQDIDLEDTADISTATMSADIAWDVEAGAGTWIKFRLKLKSPGGSWATPKTSAQYGPGDGEIQSWANSVDVKDVLKSGGDGTWRVGFMIEMSRDLLGANVIGWWDDCSLDIVASSSSSGSTTETITLSDTSSATMSLSQSTTDTITLSDSGALSLSADPTFRYYLGAYNGKVYAEDSAYKSDDGTAIDAYWESKETDFAEEGMESHDKFKTIYKLRLWYADISSTAVPVTISVKADGGSTWTPITETVGGSGDDTDKSKDFHIIKTGHSFRFRIENDSTDDEFQWSALEVYYTLGGDYFQA